MVVDRAVQTNQRRPVEAMVDTWIESVDLDMLPVVAGCGQRSGGSRSSTAVTSYTSGPSTNPRAVIIESTDAHSPFSRNTFSSRCKVNFSRLTDCNGPAGLRFNITCFMTVNRVRSISSARASAGIPTRPPASCDAYHDVRDRLAAMAARE